jgi:hypothetical protein
MTEAEMIRSLVENYTKQLTAYQDLKGFMQRIRRELELTANFSRIIEYLRQRNLLFHSIEALDAQIKDHKISWEQSKNRICTTEAEILRSRLKQVQNLLGEIIVMERDLENTINRIAYARDPVR